MRPSATTMRTAWPLLAVVCLAGLGIAWPAGVSAADEPTLAPPPDLAAPPLLAPLDDNPGEAPAFESSAMADSGPQGEVLPAPPSASQIVATGPLPREHHPWARHEPGAWRRVRIVSESFDERGVLVSRSETRRRETLVSFDGARYTLRTETSVNVGGQRMPGDGQELSYDLLTDSPESGNAFAKGEPTTISLGGAAVPCERWEWTLPRTRGEMRESAYYSPEVEPHVLKRQRTETLDGKTIGEWETRVVRVGVPRELGSAIELTHHEATEHTNAAGYSSERFAVIGATPPGGLVSESTLERDAAGRRVRWTVTHLVAFGDASGAEQSVAPAGGEPAADPEPLDIRPRRWLRMLRRGELRIPLDMESENPAEGEYR